MIEFCNEGWHTEVIVRMIVKAMSNIVVCGILLVGFLENNITVISFWSFIEKAKGVVSLY